MTTPAESVEPNRQHLLLLRMAATLLANRDVNVLARRADVSADQLRAELDAVGPALREIPKAAWEQFQTEVVLHSVPGADPPSLETVVPLWTEAGPAARGARVQLIFYNGADQAPTYWISGFVDFTPTPAGPSAPAELVLPPVPLDMPPPRGENPVPVRWRQALSDIVHRLVAGDYAGLRRDGIIAPLVDGEQDPLKHWIEEYHDPLVDLPETAWEWSDHDPVYDGPGDYGVVLSMWTAHQRPGLLSLEADVFDGGGDDIRVEVLSVHVM